LLIGLGAGWLLFGRASGPAMDAKQQRAWSKFEASGKYDAGSIRMLGEQYGITAWYATQDGAKTECIMLTPSKQVSIGCLPADRDKNGGPGIRLPLSTQVEFGDDDGTVVSGVILSDVNGAPTAMLQKWGMSTQESEWTDAYQDDELVIAKSIVNEAGIEGSSLQIIGYNGDTPIWLSIDQAYCLYAADLGGIIQQTCDPDPANVVLTLPNVSYGVRETSQGAQLTTLAVHGSTVDGAADQKTE
jgi:hypothetical protein